MKYKQKVIMMKIICVMVIGTLVVSGCATVKETHASDGRKAYALNCSGLTRGWDKCQKAAGDLCGSAGYDILDQVSEDASFGRERTTSISGSSHSIKTNERSMLIACKKGKNN
jgi:uncharacterized protein YceK